MNSAVRGFAVYKLKLTPRRSRPVLFGDENTGDVAFAFLDDERCDFVFHGAADGIADVAGAALAACGTVRDVRDGFVRPAQRDATLIKRARRTRSA